MNADLRGKGIGKALYAEVIQYAVNRNVKRLEWVVLDWNKNAIDFYESSGAKPSFIKSVSVISTLFVSFSKAANSLISLKT